MFTGLIQDVGTVESLDRGPEGARLRIATQLAGELSEGDSIAVHGACLTATAVDANAFNVDVMNRTLEHTSLGSLETGGHVNLELAVRPSDRLGGHIVQGHVDGTGRVASVRDDGFARRLEVDLPPELLRFVIPRGSIAIDGVSFTIAEVSENGFELSLIPETLARTTLGEVAEGQVVNIEVDQVARYVDRLLSPFKERNE